MSLTNNELGRGTVDTRILAPTQRDRRLLALERRQGMTELMDGLHLHEEAVSAEMQADLLAFVEAQLSDGRHGTGALTPKTYTVPAQPLPPLPSPSISPSALPAAPSMPLPTLRRSHSSSPPPSPPGAAGHVDRERPGNPNPKPKRKPVPTPTPEPEPKPKPKPDTWIASGQARHPTPCQPTLRHPTPCQPTLRQPAARLPRPVLRPDLSPFLSPA